MNHRKQRVEPSGRKPRVEPSGRKPRVEPSGNAGTQPIGTQYGEAVRRRTAGTQPIGTQRHERRAVLPRDSR